MTGPVVESTNVSFLLRPREDQIKLVVLIFRRRAGQEHVTLGRGSDSEVGVGEEDWNSGNHSKHSEGCMTTRAF